jgi:hypothetical protein
MAASTRNGMPLPVSCNTWKPHPRRRAEREGQEGEAMGDATGPQCGGAIIASCQPKRDDHTLVSVALVALLKVDLPSYRSGAEC